VLLITPILTVAASDLHIGSLAAYDGISATRPGNYVTKTVKSQGLTITIKGLTEKNSGRILKMFSMNIPASLKSGKPYTLRDQSFIDAEKYSTEPEGELGYKHKFDYNKGYDACLCWASAAADMLWISGYGKKAISPLTKKAFKNEDEVFDYFRKCFSDYGGDADGAVEYFLKGTYKYKGDHFTCQLREDAPKGGLLKNMYKYADLKRVKYSAGPGVLRLLDNLANVSASIVVDYFSKKDGSAAGAHALAVVGVVVDKRETDYKKRYKGLIIADSDNTPVIDHGTSTDSPEVKAEKAALRPNVYTFYPLTFENKGTDKRWVIKNYEDSGDYLTKIKEVFTIKDRP
jgi:hypothetical protein